jgi:ankyrin repeat protein
MNGEMFCQMCIEGKYNEVEKALNEDPDLVDEMGSVAPAHRAQMAKNGADKGWTPLHLAAHYGQEKIVWLLIDRGAELDIKSQNKIGNTPLMAAVAGGKLEIVNMLLENGADPDEEDASGNDALTLAEESGKKEIAEAIRGFTGED